MKLIINGSMEQLINVLKMLDMGLSVLDIANDVIHVNLNRDGKSCVVETLEIDDAAVTKSEPVAKELPKEPKKRKPKPVKTPAVAVAVPPPAKSEAPSRAAPEYADRVCKICGTTYKPTGPRGQYCPECVTMYGKRCAEVAAKVEAELNQTSVESQEDGRPRAVVTN